MPNLLYYYIFVYTLSLSLSLSYSHNFSFGSSMWNFPHSNDIISIESSLPKIDITLK